LGADLIVVLDECTPFNVDKSYTEESMKRSHRWALRSLVGAPHVLVVVVRCQSLALMPSQEEFQRTATGRQALYGIIQGGIYEDLRVESANFM
jgi:queuine tRNA-ribosyltransferase